jgi:hypothetical protein
MILPELVDTLQSKIATTELQPADDVLLSLSVVSRDLALTFPRRNAPSLLPEIVCDFHGLPPFRADFLESDTSFQTSPGCWFAARQPCIWDQGTVLFRKLCSVVGGSGSPGSQQ